MSRLYLSSVTLSARRCVGRRLLVSPIPLCVRAGFVVSGGCSASEYYAGVDGRLFTLFVADVPDLSGVCRVFLDEDTPLECEVVVGKSGRTLRRQGVFYDKDLCQLYTDGAGCHGVTTHGRGAYFVRLCL